MSGAQNHNQADYSTTLLAIWLLWLGSFFVFVTFDGDQGFQVQGVSSMFYGFCYTELMIKCVSLNVF